MDITGKKVVWEVIAELFRSERSANTACNKIYKVHG
jgi:hypothetical protein